MDISSRSNSRGGQRVIWFAVHSTEGNDNPRADDARGLRDASWWASSAHAIADDEPGTLLMGLKDGLPDESRASWTLRNGNPYSVNIELVGMAGWSREQWLAQPRLLDYCARWLAAMHAKFPWVPLRRLSLAEIRGRQPGVIGHVDYTNATGDGTHWDPGPGFPWDVVLAKANQYATGSAPAKNEDDDDMKLKPYRVKGTSEVRLGGPGIWYGVPSNANLNDLKASGTISDDSSGMDCTQAAFDAARVVWLSAVVGTPLHSANDPRGDWGLVDRLPAMDVAGQETRELVKQVLAALAPKV